MPPGGCPDRWRKSLADAPRRGLQRISEIRFRRSAQRRRTARRRHHRSLVPARIYRIKTLGPSRYCLHGMARRAQTLDGEGTHRRGGACADQARAGLAAPLRKTCVLLLSFCSPPSWSLRDAGNQRKPQASPCRLLLCPIFLPPRASLQESSSGASRKRCFISSRRRAWVLLNLLSSSAASGSTCNKTSLP